MLCNLHTHSLFCDGKNSPEEIVITAIEKGFNVLGFSGHTPTYFGESYGITDMNGYINEILRLKEKYKDKIEVCLGLEDDALCPAENRKAFEYIIGSHHYIRIGQEVLPADLSAEGLQQCIDLLGGELSSLAEAYYSQLCDYILRYKPDIIGHFDLITKFDEQRDNPLQKNVDYNKIAEKYLKSVVGCGSIFEVNTGAISRGYRTSPYPAENLLNVIKKEQGAVLISSDAHQAENLDYGFGETLKYLKDLGFKQVFVYKDKKFVKRSI